MSVQPRIRLSRSFDQRSHNYLGYALRVEGIIDGQEGEFLVGIGKAAQAKHHFKVGDSISGQSHPVLDNRLEAVEYYKTSGLKVIECSNIPEHDVPPWQGIPPDIETYRERGHRRLAAQTYNVKCQKCLWGCKMAVEMIIDHWNPKQKRFRYETFCYGPKSCALYMKTILHTAQWMSREKQTAVEQRHSLRWAGSCGLKFLSSFVFSRLLQRPSYPAHW